MSTNQIYSRPGQYLTFKLNNRSFGVPIGTVKEINQIGEITPVPQSPNFVAGVINLRGRVIPVIDLRVKLDLVASPFTRETCVIVIENPYGPMGMIVDAVMDVVSLTESQLEPPPLIQKTENKAITGVAKVESRVLILLDFFEIINDQFVRELNVPQTNTAA